MDVFGEELISVGEEAFSVVSRHLEASKIRAFEWHITFPSVWITLHII